MTATEITFLEVDGPEHGGPTTCSRCFAVVSDRWQDHHAAWHAQTDDRDLLDSRPIQH